MVKFFNLIKSIVLGTTVRKKIVKYYFAIILFGAFFFLLPFATKDNQSLTFLEAFFTSATAFTDNGLNSINHVEKLSGFGQFLNLFLIEIGGLGIMAIKVFIFMFIGKKLNVSDRLLIFTEHSQEHLGGMVKLIKTAISFFVIFQIILTILFTIHFIIYYDYSSSQSLWQGLYYAISCSNSAGYSLYSNSYENFSGDYLFQTYTIIGLFIGGIGFPIINESVIYFKRKLNNERHHFSFFYKLTMSSYFVITFIALIIFSITERNTILADGLNIDSAFKIVFQVTSLRSAGCLTIPMDEISNAGHLLGAILMFIGVNPASTGGGIRTTTIAIIVLYMFSSIGHSKVTPELFNRRIGMRTVQRALTVFAFAFFIVLITLISILAESDNFNFFDALIESVSAFGTIGLSKGITADLSVFNQILLIIGTIIGRIGILGTLLMFTSKQFSSELIKFPEEDITIG
ncbi:MAG: potassium transporter TrkG [Erysipelotrichales bacterium]